MSQDEILRLNEIVGDEDGSSSRKGLFPVSRSTWLRGVRTGIYPQPIRLSQRRVGWLRSDIEALVTKLMKQGEVFGHSSVQDTLERKHIQRHRYRKWLFES